MRVGAVDIGTNSMRLLVRDEDQEFGRWVEVTGLGRGVDATGELSAEAIDRTVEALRKFGTQIEALGVERRAAIATSATRDASNRDVFLDSAEQALGVRPDVITGAEEGLYAFDGATAELTVAEPVLVSDIGGGSTELIGYDTVMSIDMGSVRLTDRMSDSYPLGGNEKEAAREIARSAFRGIETPQFATHTAVAGTWTSLAAIAQDLLRYDRNKVHGYILAGSELDRVVDMLCDMTMAEIEVIPSLDPKRAPVIRAGALVAQAVVGTLDVAETFISERDSLDGLARELLGLR